MEIHAEMPFSLDARSLMTQAHIKVGSDAAGELQALSPTVPTATPARRRSTRLCEIRSNTVTPKGSHTRKQECHSSSVIFR